MIEIGSLVRSTTSRSTTADNKDLGIGKVIELSNLQAIVEYFDSISQRIKKTVLLSSLEWVELQRQTRCYFWLDQETWLMGRINSWDQKHGCYEIDLPDKETALVEERQIYVRCDRLIEDPTEVLAMKGHDTPYFHNLRSRFVQCLVEQRAVSRGMTGLISANIELFPHQVEVVRRVLEDPIQRYLLADEVGLGKTIEAGVILRQYLLDEPQGCALVLVPQYLVAQWRQELEDKFYLSHFGDRVQLLAVEDLGKSSLNNNINLLILDEAHHIAALATSSNVLSRQCFENCKRLAHKSDRLLLLSATPVLNNEQDFLAMLHLLDPTTYRLDDLSGFRERVQNRQEIGRVLLSFRETAKPFVLKTKLTQLRNLFTKDQYLQSLADELEKCLQEQEQREQIVRAIHTHISDTYRLHRRMLRNHRVSVEDVIFDRNATPRIEYDLDQRSLNIHELLDEWRIIAPNQQYSRIFLILFRASSTLLSILKKVVEARLNTVSSAELIQEFGNEDIKKLIETPKFPREEEILKSLLTTLQQPADPEQAGMSLDRIELLKMVLLNQLSVHLKIKGIHKNQRELLEKILQRIRRPLPGDDLPKIVIFTSFVRACQEIVSSLAATFGERAIAKHQVGHSKQVEENLQKFKTDPNCFILVCDPSGEEGRNLQFCDWLIHFDLPWSPNRLEQRIGRLDRIGGKMAVQFFVLAGPHPDDIEDNPQQAWYQILKDGFGIFNQSIASLQFYVEEKLPQLEATLFKSGAAGLLEMIEPIQTEIAAENVKISEQNTLDEIDALDQGATSYFQTLDNYDARHPEIQKAIEGWIRNALQFNQISDPNISGVLRYQPTTRTLVPINDLINRFASYSEESGTYSRRVANQHNHVNLYRIGQGLIEAFASHIRWDDRGQAFAMWRHEQSWAGEGKEWLGFRFDYVIETELEAAKQILQTKGRREKTNYQALARRADALFPPIWETIFLDAQKMCVVEDEELLKILQRPYYGKSSHQRDYNLAKDRLAILDEFIDADKWEDFCKSSRSTSEVLLRDRSSFIDLCQERALFAQQKLDNRLEQLRLRLNRLSENKQNLDGVLAQELNTESALSKALVDGIRHPRLSLDSVGLIIVSGQPPFEIK